jgi:O-antigen ligase
LDLDLPEKVNSSEELIRYGCRHINLEEIAMEKMQGNLIKEIYRSDPNVDIRGQIYQKSWTAIKEHPFLGIGYGTIPVILGRDEQGNNLNASNIFLEVWLGSGLIGLIALILIWLNAMAVFVKHFWWAESQTEKTFALFILLGSFALLIPNLFNAGIFLMILWFFWGIVPIKFKN